MSTEFGTVQTKTKIESEWANAIIDHAFEKHEDYIVRKKAVGSWEAIYGGGSNQAGKILQTADGPVEAIQAAHDQLTYGGIIGVKAGRYAKEWENKLNVTNPGVTLKSAFGYSDGYFGAALNVNYFQAIDSLNKDMISISGKTCRVFEFCLDGNKANNTSGKGIVVTPTATHCLIERTNILKTKQYGLEDDGLETDLYIMNIEACDSYGLYSNGFGGVYYRVNSYLHSSSGIKLVHTSGRVKMLYCFGDSTGGNGFTIDGALHQFRGCKAGLNWLNGFNINGATDSVFDIYSYDNGQAINDTYSNILLQDADGNHALRNAIRAICKNDEANKAAYNIREADANQDYNVVASGTIVRDAVTANVSLQGVNSKKSADCIEI